MEAAARDSLEMRPAENVKTSNAIHSAQIIMIPGTFCLYIKGGGGG